MKAGEPNHDGRKDQHRIVARVEFFVTRGNATELPDAVKEAFDKVARSVLMGIEVAGIAVTRTRRKIGLGASVTDGLDQCLGVIAFVSDHLFGGHIRHEGGRFNDVVDLSRRQPPSRRVTEGIDQRVDLGRQPTARATDRLWTVFSLRQPRADARE